MLTKDELDFCERVPRELGRIADELAKLRGVQTDAPSEKEKDTDTFDTLSVTSVQVFPFKEGPMIGHLKGFASVVLNDQLQIRGLRIMDGEHGLFVAYPLDPFYKGEDLRSICFPITKQLKEHIENCVLEKYKDVTE